MIVAQGSARSVEGVSIHDALQHCSEHLISFGGHAMAAGLRLSIDRVEQFRQSLVQYINDKLDPEDLQQTIRIDLSCRLADIDLRFCQQLKQLEPFGKANPRPIFCARDVRIDQAPKVMGKTGGHLRLMLRDERSLVQAVAFGMGDLAEHLPRGARVDVVFEPKLSTWRDVQSPEIHVKDIKLR